MFETLLPPPKRLTFLNKPNPPRNFLKEDDTGEELEGSEAYEDEDWDAVEEPLGDPSPGGENGKFLAPALPEDDSVIAEFVFFFKNLSE